MDWAGVLIAFFNNPPALIAFVILVGLPFIVLYKVMEAQIEANTRLATKIEDAIDRLSDKHNDLANKFEMLSNKVDAFVDIISSSIKGH